MRWTVVMIEFEKETMVLDPDVVAVQLINDALKNIDVEAMTEEQFYSTLKNELLKKKGVHRVVIIRGLYAPSRETACKSAHEIFDLTYRGGLPRGCVAIPSFYQIIDPVATDDWLAFIPLAIVGGITLAVATISTGKNKKAV